MPVRSSPTLVWFRQDLRLADNPALTAAAEAAVERGAPVVAVYVLDEETPGEWRPGGAARWWLHGSLTRLEEALARRGVPLVLRRGPAAREIPSLAAESGAETVLWNRCYEPWAIRRDRDLKTRLKAAGLQVRSFAGNLLHEPWTVTTGADRPYTVYTPFWRAVRDRAVPEPLPEPQGLTGGPAPDGARLEDWNLQPRSPDWADGLREMWTPGEAGAHARLQAFLDAGLAHYGSARNRPDVDGSSRLSPHLHWGELTAAQVWHAVLRHTGGAPDENAVAFLNELGWRDFAHHLLYHWPSLPDETWRDGFRDFPWREDPEALDAWQRGRTGFPIVDAGMRQLWQTGWMHNRVRMIVGSFLVKDLLIHWRTGERWFWDTLVDADAANNAAQWQWVAGCGADAAPYFRIFNPVTQGEKFDPQGAYVRKWVREVAGLPDKYVHKPWEAPAEVLERAGVGLGQSYPHPLVDHAQARRAALAAFEGIKKGAA
jgi:deoxyribodipyrimidine photo-lyase